jgi:ribonuclease Z
MAAQTALAAGVKRLVLTHLSPRYLPGNPMTPDDLLAEARAIFPETLIARDFLSLEVGPLEEPAGLPPSAAAAAATAGGERGAAP